jgi:hypothetical protein
LCPVPPQFSDGQDRQRDKPASAGLGTLLYGSAMLATGAAGNDSQLPTIQIDIAPTESAYLASAEAAENAEQNRDIYCRAPCRIEHLGRGLGVDSFHFLALHFGRLHQGSGIERDRPPHTRLREGRFKHGMEPMN